MSARRRILLSVTAGAMIYVVMSATPVVLLAQQAEPKVDQKPGASDRSDAAIAAMIIQESRNAYYATGHPCACPDDLMRNARRCGGTSAHIRPGGAHPLCFNADVSPEMIRQYRAQSARK
jgi:hypothetical protein